MRLPPAPPHGADDCPYQKSISVAREDAIDVRALSSVTAHRGAFDSPAALGVPSH